MPASRKAADAATRRALEGDLDAILHKALKNDAAERYLTVQDFAADLERHLADQPVLARPDTLGYRLRKYTTRHALRVGAASAVALAVIAGSVVSLWQAQTARRQSVRAEQEAQRAEQTKNFALSLFRAAESTRGAGAATTAVDLLLDAQRRVETELKDKPESAVELMTAIAESLAGQSKLEEAASLARKAVTLGSATLGPDQVRTLEAEAVLGAALVNLGRFDETIALLTGTVERARRADASHSLVVSLVNLGLAEVAKDQFDEGVGHCRAAVDLLEQPQLRTDGALAASVWLTYANALVAARRPGIAAAAQRAIALDRAQAGGRMTANSLLARGYYARGLLLEDHDREALSEYESLLADGSRFFGPNHREVANLANSLGMARLAAGFPDLAAEAFGRALDAARHSDGANPMVEAIMTYNVGNSLLSAGHWNEALAAFDQLGELLRKSPPASNQLRWQAEARRSKALVRLGRSDAAERALRSLMAEPLDLRSRAYAQDQLAALRSAQGRHAEAIAAASEALATLGKKGSVTDYMEAYRVLGNAHLAAGHGAEAVEPLQKALDLYHKRELGISAGRIETAEALARATRLRSADSPKG